MNRRPTTQSPRAVILLSAGQGARLRPLTDKCPKSLLRIGDTTILQTILDPLLETGPREIIIVTGFESRQIEGWVARTYPEKTIRTVKNSRFREDTNILSVRIGVEALQNPEHGYFIVETDIIATPGVWRSIVAQETRRSSYWVTRGVYGPDLTGGIVNVDSESVVTDIRYEPEFNPRFAGWPKMLGVLSVGPGEVKADIEARDALAAQSISQYYMAPWIAHASRLPCSAFDLRDQFAMSFNTPEAFEEAQKCYASLDQS